MAKSYVIISILITQLLKEYCMGGCLFGQNRSINQASPPQSIHGRERYQERKVIEQYSVI